MDAGDVIVVLVVAAAPSFDFTNGFHEALRRRGAVTVVAALQELLH